MLLLHSGGKREGTHEGVAISRASAKKPALILLLCDRSLPQTPQAGGLQGLIGPGQAGSVARPRVCLRAGGELPSVEHRLWGDDCYSTGVGFKEAFLMGGMRFTGESRELWRSQTTRRLIGGNILPSAGDKVNSRTTVRKSDVCFFTDAGFADAGGLSSCNERKYLKASRHTEGNEAKMYMYVLFYLFIVFEGVTRHLNNWVKSTRHHVSPP